MLRWESVGILLLYNVGGALIKASKPDYETLTKATDALREVFSPEFNTITTFNDETTANHADLLVLFDRALALANTETVS